MANGGFEPQIVAENGHEAFLQAREPDTLDSSRHEEPGKAASGHAERVGGSAVVRFPAASDEAGRFWVHFRSQAGTRSALIARLKR